MRPAGQAGIGDGNQGAGLSADDLPHIFEPFFRTAEAHRRGQSGVGLGLAIVRRVADLFGGTVAVSSEPGRGSRFELRLPIATDTMPAPRHCEPALGLASARA